MLAIIMYVDYWERKCCYWMIIGVIIKEWWDELTKGHCSRVSERLIVISG